MPAYNVAPYIGETLESVFAQTFTDYEIIIVNDGSPDTEDLERALEPFRDRVRYFKQENLGAGAARQRKRCELHAENSLLFSMPTIFGCQVTWSNNMRFMQET